MRIGIFTETYTPYISGLVTSELMLKNALEKKGHTVYVVTANLTSSKYEYDEKEKVLRIPGIPTGIYDSRLTSIYPIKAINKIKSWDLEVIHSQTEFAIGTFARLFAKQYNIPIVHTYHTMYEDYVHYIPCFRVGEHSFIGKKKMVGWIRDKVIPWYMKWFSNHCDLVLASSAGMRQILRQYGVTARMEVLPTGLADDFFVEKDIRKVLYIYFCIQSL